MIKIRYLLIIFLTLSFLLLAFGFYPLTNSVKATTEGASLQSEKGLDFQCAEILKISKNTQKSLKTLERLVGYLDASVNDIKMTVNGINRKLNTDANQASKEIRS